MGQLQTAVECRSVGVKWGFEGGVFKGLKSSPWKEERGCHDLSKTTFGVWVF